MVKYLGKINLTFGGGRQEATENIINLIVILRFYISLIALGKQDKSAI
jgi:hypothetical protein